MRAIRWAVFFLAVGTVSACASSKHTTGREIPQEKVDRIVKGQTTKDQILQWFGAPVSQSEMGGDILYIYRHSVHKGSAFSLGYYTGSSGKEQSDELTITFDKSTGRVKNYSIQRGIEA